MSDDLYNEMLEVEQAMMGEQDPDPVMTELLELEQQFSDEWIRKRAKTARKQENYAERDAEYQRDFPGRPIPSDQQASQMSMWDLADRYTRQKGDFRVPHPSELNAIPEKDRTTFLSMVSELAAEKTEGMEERGSMETLKVRATRAWENWALNMSQTVRTAVPGLIDKEIAKASQFKRMATQARRGGDPAKGKTWLGEAFLQAIDMAPAMVGSMPIFYGGGMLAPAIGKVGGLAYWTGQIYPNRRDELISKGVAENVAGPVAMVDAMVEAQIEQMNLIMEPGAASSYAGVAGQFALSYLKEYGEEAAQGLAAMGALRVATWIDPEAPEPDWGDEGSDLIKELKGVAAPLAIMMGPGMALGAAGQIRGIPGAQLARQQRDDLLTPSGAAQWAIKYPMSAEELAEGTKTPSRKVISEMLPNVQMNAKQRAEFARQVKEMFPEVKKFYETWDRAHDFIAERAEEVEPTAEEVTDATEERGAEEIPAGEQAGVGEQVGAPVRVTEGVAVEGVPPAGVEPVAAGIAGEAAARPTAAQAHPADLAAAEAERAGTPEARAARIAAAPAPGPGAEAPAGVAPEGAGAEERVEGAEITPSQFRRVPVRKSAAQVAPGTQVPGFNTETSNIPDDADWMKEGKPLTLMSPTRYIETVVAMRKERGFPRETTLRLPAESRMKRVQEQLASNKAFPLSFDYERGQQDGLHRAQAAKAMGLESVAVIVRSEMPAEAQGRKPLADYGQKVSPQIPVAVAPTIEREAVVRAFPGTQVTRLAKGEGFRVELPSGQYFEIKGKADIPVDWEAAEAAAGRTFSQAERDNLAAAGAVQLNMPDGTATDGMGVILISQQVGQKGLIRHEGLHLARQAGFFSESEWDALVKKYSNEAKSDAQQEEDVANTRYVQHKARSLWTQLKTWFRKMLDTLGLKPIDAKSVETMMEGSAFWARRPDIRGGQQAQSLVQRPELAIPTVTPEARGLVEEQDVARAEAGVPAVRADAEVQAEAETRLNADYPGEVLRLQEIANRGGQLSDVDTIIAKTILNREATQAVQSNDPVKLKDAMALIDSYRRTGTEQARAFRQRYDPLETPAQRRARIVSEALLTPNRGDREKLEAAHEKGDMAEVERIRDATVDKFDKMRQGLLDMDIDINNLDAHMQDPETAARLIGSIRAAKADVWDAMYEFFVNSILSAPTTQMANMIGNTTHGFWHFTAQRFTEALVNTFIKSPTGAQWGEFRHILAGTLPGLVRGARNFARTWKTETPWFEAELGRTPTTKLDMPQFALKGKWGRFVRTFGYRLLLAADELAKGLIAEMEVGAQAYRMAKAQGLEGEAMADRMMDLVNDTQSEAWSAAINTAVELTFQKRGGKATEAILNFRRKVPGVRYQIPFVTTPMNIFKIGIRKSPFGVLPMGAKIYKAVKTNNWNNVPVGAAEQILAWGAVLLLLGNNEDDPWITGAVAEMEKGPRELARRTFPPQSVRLGNMWFSYARLEPFATTIGLTVDTLNAIKRGEPGKMITLPYKALVGQVKNKTFLRGLGDMVNLVENPRPEQLAQMASSFAVSWIPNVARSAIRSASDNYPVRGVWGKGSEWARRLGKRTIQRTELGLIQDQPAYDLWGRLAKRPESPMPYTDWLWRFTLPIRTKEEDIFIGDRLILNWNFQNPEDEKYPVSPSKYYTKQGKRIYWTDEQYTDFVRIAGEIAREAVEAGAAEIDADNPSAGNIKWIQRTIARARRIAKRRVLSAK